MKKKALLLVGVLTALGLLLAPGPAGAAYGFFTQLRLEAATPAPKGALIASWNGPGRPSFQAGLKGSLGTDHNFGVLKTAQSPAAHLISILGVILMGLIIILVVYASLRPGGRPKQTLKTLNPEAEELHRLAENLAGICDSLAREASERTTLVEDCTIALTEAIIRNKQNISRSALLRALNEKAGEGFNPEAAGLARITSEFTYVRQAAEEIGRLAKKLGDKERPAAAFPEDKPARSWDGALDRRPSSAVADIAALAANMIRRAETGLDLTARSRDLMLDLDKFNRLGAALVGDLEEAAEGQNLNLNKLCTLLLRLDHAEQSGPSAAVNQAVAGDQPNTRAEVILKKIDELAAVAGVAEKSELSFRPSGKPPQ